MNILVSWAAMNEAIRVLLQNENASERRDVLDDPKKARLQNICLPRIMADGAFRERHFKEGWSRNKSGKINEINKVSLEDAREVDTEVAILDKNTSQEEVSVV